MAKKYLLYIHEELFEKEPKKSLLINNLLERHYHGTVDGKTQEEVHEDIKKVQEVISLSKLSTKDFPKSTASQLCVHFKITEDCEVCKFI